MGRRLLPELTRVSPYLPLGNPYQLDLAEDYDRATALCFERARNAFEDAVIGVIKGGEMKDFDGV